MSNFKNFIRFFFMLFYSKILYFKRKVKVDSTVFLNKKTYLEGMNVIHDKTNICGASIGYATYIGRNGFFMDTTIGKFCSIGTNVKILPYTHPTAVYVSTHPSFFSVLKQSGFTFAKNQTFNEVLYYNEQENISVKIGNDVWIGDDVKIIGGLKIGDGAIIAAGSIVTKNVPPYAIVGGIPAKVIRYRFNEEQISFLLKKKWWDKTPEWLKNNVDLFSDINNFMVANNG